ncbi:hypothetical protein LX90_006825 [Lentzea flava]|nr:hypothetical protein [Lentzea flava]
MREIEKAALIGFPMGAAPLVMTWTSGHGGEPSPLVNDANERREARSSDGRASAKAALSKRSTRICWLVMTFPFGLVWSKYCGRTRRPSIIFRNARKS